MAKLEKFVKKYNISKHFKYGLGQYGICHTLSHEEGLVSPGQVYVGGDSHTNTTGALGAFACGLGHTDMAYVMLNGKIWFKVPETVLFKLNGKLPDHVMAKDLILQIIGDIGTDGGAYGAMQFAGSGIDAMPVEERITLTNMTTEAGAKNGIIEADSKTEAYLAEHNAKPTKAVHGDSDAEYANTHEYEADKLEPLVAKPFSPQNIAPARDLSSVELNKAYIGSCTGAKDVRLGSSCSHTQGTQSYNTHRNSTSCNIHNEKSNGWRTLEDIFGCRSCNWLTYVRCMLWGTHGSFRR